MPPEFESLVCNKNTPSDMRSEIGKNPGLGEALHDAMSSTVGQKFQSMHIKEAKIKLGVPASETDMEDLQLLLSP